MFTYATSFLLMTASAAAALLSFFATVAYRGIRAARLLFQAAATRLTALVLFVATPITAARTPFLAAHFAVETCHWISLRAAESLAGACLPQPIRGVYARFTASS